MDFNQSPSGKIIKIPSGYSAFVPHSLPPNIQWNTTLVNALSRADYLLGQLAREGEKLPNPHLMMRPFITREAVLSSKIEGTRATVGEILASDAGISSKFYPEDLREVQNYITALDYGLDLLKEIPLSLRLIRKVHGKLMQGVRGDHATPGDFRKSQNWIGAPGCTLNTAKYIPPPPKELMNLLGQLESFFYHKNIPPLIHIALCHYQFEAIHPFLDGNGRIGRLLITLLLIYHEVLPSPLLYLSAFFESTREEYYRQLYAVSSQGTWNDWLIYFLSGVAIQSEDVLSRAERINNLIKTWQIKVSGDSSGFLFKIIQHFAMNPYLTAKKLSKDLNIAYTTAQRSIMKLAAQGIVEQTTDNKRDRVYCATQILQILEEPSKPL